MTAGFKSAVKARQDFLPVARENSDVQGQVATSSLWSGLGVAANTVLQFVRSMIFARLLMPADFGVVNLANVFTQFILIFANFGFSSSVIFHHDLDKRDLATSWWGNVFVDTAAAGACVLIALISSRFAESPRVAHVVCLLAVQFILMSFGTVNQALMRRQFMFRRLATVDFLGAVASFGAAFAFVKFCHWGVYGLVGGMIVGSATMTLLNFAFMPWLPSWNFSFPSLRKHFGYGRWLLGVNIVTYINGNMDRVAVGGLLSQTQLGFYEYAGNIPLMVVNKISQVINSVMFPAFSSLKDRPTELRDLLRNLYRYNALLIFPILTGMALVGPEFVAVAYGAKWMPIVTGLRLFCLYGVLRLYTQPLYSLCNGIGEQQLPFRWTLVFLPLNLALIYAGVKLWQLEGVVLVRSALPLFIGFTLGIQVMRRIKVPWSLLFRATWPAASACLAMAVVVLGLGRVHGGFMGLPLPRLLVHVIAGAGTYFAVLFFAWRSEYLGVLKLMQRFRG